MTARVLVAACALVVACGGGSAKAPVAEPPDRDDSGERVEPIEDEEITEHEDPTPPPPQEWSAVVDLVPVKGSKMKPARLELEQTEGETASLRSAGAIAGLRPGTYHLVIHQGAECGKNASQAGAPWPVAAEASIVVTVAKGSGLEVEESDLALALDGDDTVIGRTLVVHADKKGKPGKVEACGVITTPDDE